ATSGQELVLSWAETPTSFDSSSPLEVTYLARFEGAGRLYREVEATWTSLPGSVEGERSGDPSSPGGALNTYRAVDHAQLNNVRIYGFEDLKNDPVRFNDFDYNDWVIRVALDENFDGQGNWRRIELEIEALARGAGFRHYPYLDLGLEGPVDVQVSRYSGDGTLLETRELASDGEYIRDILLFPHSYAALPPWQGQPFDFATNTSPGQAGDGRTLGQRARVIVEVAQPDLNPAVEDDALTQHLDETFNHLVGPWIEVIPTGQAIRHRWRGAAASQDIVTPGLYGAGTPLLGYPLDQAESFEGTWRWPVEQLPTWSAYPSFVGFVASGRTDSKDWYETSASDAVWPIDDPLPPGPGGPQVPGTQPGAGAFAFEHVFSGPIASAPAIADLDGDGVLEVVVSAYSGEIAIFGRDGQLRSLVPPSGGVPSAASVTVADLDGDGELEIIRGDDGGTVEAFRADGSRYLSWRVDGTVKSTAAVADLDGDTASEVVVIDGGGNLHAFRLDGTELASFPIGLGGRPDQQNGFVLVPSPVLADLDGDDDLEILALNNEGLVSCFDASGSPLAGWPRDLGVPTLSTPAVGDLDRDGEVEIIVADDEGGIHVLAPSGVTLWAARRNLGGSSSPALGDLDGDGELEVVVGALDGRVYAWHADGRPVAGWPFVSGSAVQASPSTADLDGDGDDEVLIGSYDRFVYALDGDGGLYADPGFPAQLGAIILSSVAVADLDADGDPEVVLGSHDRSLYALGLAGDVLTGAVLWSQFGGSAEHGGHGSVQPTIPVDTTPPQYAALTAGAPVDSCRTYRSPVDRIDVELTEPMDLERMVPGEIRILSAGADSVFSTGPCGSPVAGDDRDLDLTMTWNPSGDRVRLEIEEQSRGLYRLQLCATLHDLSGNPLDGNGDGIAGDSGELRFRVDTENLFDNPEMDCDLGGWQPSPDAAIAFDGDDASGFEESGSARWSSVDEEGSWLEQCVSVAGDDLYLEGELRASAGGLVEALLGCAYFEQAACQGEEIRVDVETSPVAGDAWRRLGRRLPSDQDASSALCFLGFRSSGASVSDAWADRLRLLAGLFDDGFESGDAGAWSAAIGSAGSP
ncbi:MAG: FG-GAP-like repeat-containing protein, partial [Holophagales bacterium]|nr:FG-GAP-like repeat-containing protein [Holophagales bacterium]